MFGIKTKLKLQRFRQEWTKNHPDSLPVNCFNPDLVSVGRNSYGELNVVSFNDNTRLTIGNYVSIGQKVTFLLDVEHNTNTVSTYPFKAKIIQAGDEASSKGDIVIDDDVWIGYGATILSGVHIRQGAVVAAGAVVCKDVEPYSVIGGVPAKIIKYRYDKDVIDYLLSLNYGDLTKQLIKVHIRELYTPIDMLSLNEIKALYSWFPKRF